MGKLPKLFKMELGSDPYLDRVSRPSLQDTPNGSLLESASIFAPRILLRPIVNSSASTYDLSDFVRALFRNKKKVVLVPVAILGLAVLLILFAPRAYRSEAKIFMQIGRESVNIDPTATTGDTISMQSNSRDNEIVTAIDTLMSRGTIEKVVDRLGPEVVLGQGGEGEQQSNVVVSTIKAGVGTVVGLLKNIDPVSDRERAVVTIERHLDVEAENDSTLIAVRYEAETPQLAQLVAKTLVDVFHEEHLRLHRTSGSREFFTEQRDELRNRLDDAVEKLRNAKNRLNMVSVESRRGTLESRLANVEMSLLSNLQQFEATKARITDVKKQLANTPERMVAEETTVPNTGTDLLREQVFELQVLMLDQQAKFNDDHPSLQVTREQLAKAQAMLDAESRDRQEITSDINPNYSSLKLSLANQESELAGLVAQKSELDQQREQVLADLKKLNDYELEIDQLNRESALARDNYFRYAANLEKTRINEELDKNAITNAILAQEATLAEKPVSPNKLLIAALSLMLSFSSVVALVLFSEKLDHPIYRENQLEEALDLPVFGVVPEQRRPLMKQAR